MVSNTQNMDNSRQQYVPGPPLSHSQGNVSHLPPPPPRPYPQSQGTAIPPPPPGPHPSTLPPGTVYGLPGGWQQSWGRPSVSHGLPPPPPLAQMQNQTYGYGNMKQRNPGQMSVLPPPPHYEKPPMLSATFIPGGDSFGPGVGIPPFEDHSTFWSQQDNPYPGQPPPHGSETTGQENRSASASSARIPLTLALHDASPTSPGPPTATLRNPQPPISRSESNLTGTVSRQRAHSTAVTIQSNDAASQWPLDRVLTWLAANSFSNDWQETFRSLNLHGEKFLEIGKSSRSYTTRMHKDIYPMLAQVCTNSNTGWDQGRERQEAKRMRSLVARLNEGTDVPLSAGGGHRRRESALNLSASTDGNVENSPHVGVSQFGVSPSTAGTEESPGKQMPPSIIGNFGSRGSQGRSSTMPVFSKPSNATPSDGRHPESFGARSDYRGMLNGYGGRGRHSPGLSGDGSQGLGLRQIDGSPSASPNLEHVTPMPTQSVPNLSSGRSEHTKSNSIDSTLKQTSRFSTSTNLSAETGPSGRFYDNRRNGDEHGRPQMAEGGRTYSNEGASKEHSKGIFSRFRRQKHDPNIDDQPLESPISQPVSSRTAETSEPAFTPAPRLSHEHDGFEARTQPLSQTHRRFIFATHDYWNYRLVDVTEVENAAAIRALICNELGELDSDYVQVFVTEPGQQEHDEALSDGALVAARAQADPLGTLKLYIKIPQRSSISRLQGNGQGSSFHAKSHTVSGSRGEAMAKSSSAEGFTQRPIQSGSEFETPEALQKAADEWRRETERKQRAYLETRQNGKDLALPNTTIRAPRVIDFDAPRMSPYEDKKMELVPVRKPPVAPSESNTLTKVNSLRKSGSNNRSSMDALKRISDPIAEETDRGRKRMSGGIGAALANVGKLAGTPATSASTQNITSTEQAKVPNPSIQTLRRRDASPVSPSGGRPTSGLFARPLLPRVKSYGPDFEFKEPNVAFTASPNPQADNNSDDDSDDGLFAIPLTNKSVPREGLRDAAIKDQKPTLTLNTDQQSRASKSVVFRTPNSGSVISAGPAGDESAGPSARSGYNRSFSDDSTGFSWSAISPSEAKSRPDSFVSDIWANRPAVENVVDRLDQFFPGVDLDQPYLEEAGENASPIPGLGRDPLDSAASSIRDRVGFVPDNLPLELTRKRDESDTLGSDESTLKESNKNKVVSVASRQISRAGGGLGRMKSIREVAQKRNNDIVRGPSTTVTRKLTQRENNLTRRKSTKMFGSRIVQIKPERGNRLSTLDPIPQDEIPTDDTPKRQATFKIIRGQLIGKGTYGRVYLGMNATTGEFLAVKQVEVNQKAAGHDRDRIKDMVASLDKEIDTMQHLEHPNIVQYLGCERKEFSISIYLEYIPGGSIGSCLRKHGKFEEPVVRSLTQQTLKGLAYLHGEGILHRDLKADNILLDLDGTCKISDFGISIKSDKIYGNDVTNSMQGSVFWMAPEVVRAQGQGYSADIWSLGCVVLEMFAGKRPWSRDEAVGAIFKLGKNEAPPIPEDVQNTASLDGLNFMWDCFQINANERPTADTLLSCSTFSVPEPFYNFYDTNLAVKLRTSEIAPSGI